MEARMTLPWTLIAGMTVFFFSWERIFPGRELPETPGWYLRAAFLNACQVGIVLLAGGSWNGWLHRKSLFHIAVFGNRALEGFLGWFVGTFVFYWWHRARHDSNFLWRVCHQIHHSPRRIEVLTAFYKHPVEIAADSFIGTVLLYLVLGASVERALWFNVFAAF